MQQPPKRTKFRKAQKGNMRGVSPAHTIAFGMYGLQLTACGHLNARQIEAARRVVVRHLKRTGDLWIRLFPDKPISEKPLEVRQGKGKGNVAYYAYVVKPGAILFELAGVPENMAREALKLASAKLPMSARFIKRSVESTLQEDA